MEEPGRALYWIGSSLDDLRKFPDEVRQMMGFALWRARRGEKSPSAKPLRGFVGAGVLEIIEDFGGDTYRAVYTARFSGVVFVLLAFQKQSKSGKATPQKDVELIKSWLKDAAAHFRVLVTQKGLDGGN